VCSEIAGIIPRLWELEIPTHGPYWIKSDRAEFRNREPQLIEPHHGKAWALMASIDGGEIPEKHSIQLIGEHDLLKVSEWSKETFIAGLASQPYTAGLGKFTAKFDSEESYAATIAIEKGVHDERATAVFFEQGVHRCLLTRRIQGASADEALWLAMKDWAEFQPKRSSRRSDPGQFFYPAEHTHVFQKYWDFLNDPLQHRDSEYESDRTKSFMYDMARAFEGWALENWDPQLSDVVQKGHSGSRTMALSRGGTRYMIQWTTGTNRWSKFVRRKPWLHPAKFKEGQEAKIQTTIPPRISSCSVQSWPPSKQAPLQYLAVLLSLTEGFQRTTRSGSVTASKAPRPTVQGIKRDCRCGHQRRRCPRGRL
jgi:hypothetical protein